MYRKLLTTLGLLCASSFVTALSTDDKVRGVNLGGWLVLEPWITPSLFEATGDESIIDEYTFGQKQDKAIALAALEKHWNTWITERDLAAIAAAGLNHVRVPIGYWAFEAGYDESEPYITGQLPYLKKAIGWAGKYGLKVIVDLHGAPGSQNGFDNSGQKVSYPGWHSNPSYVERTNAVIKSIAEMFKDDPVARIIAPLNEPAGFYGDDILNVTKQYWLDSYNSVRAKSTSNTVLIHDAFQDLKYWDDFMPEPEFKDVSIDKHIYQVFSDAEVARTELEHLATACSYQPSLAAFHLPVIIGEWSLALTDCAKYLNGRGVGNRFEGTYPGSKPVGSCKGLTGKASTFDADYRTTLRKYWEAQVISYEKGAGWIFWTWKAEEADEWSYQAGLLNGWIPANPKLLLFPRICS